MGVDETVPLDADATIKGMNLVRSKTYLLSINRVPEHLCVDMMNFAEYCCLSQHETNHASNEPLRSSHIRPLSSAAGLWFLHDACHEETIQPYKFNLPNWQMFRSGP